MILSKPSPPAEPTKLSKKDKALIEFIIKNAKNYDRWEIFLRAQEQEPVLNDENVLDLYLRYHRYLFPVLTGKPSDESIDLFGNSKIFPKSNFEDKFTQIVNEETEIPDFEKNALKSTSPNGNSDDVFEGKSAARTSSSQSKSEDDSYFNCFTLK